MCRFIWKKYDKNKVVMQLLILPRCLAAGPHTVGLQRPLEQRKAGCRTMWPEAPQAGRSSRIQNLHREEHQGKESRDNESLGPIKH